MNNTIRFYRVDDDYGIFSNFSNHPIEVDGIIWKTSEHYFQAQKFHDEKTRLKVINAASPGEAALIGRDRNNILRNDWEQIKDDVMRKVVLAKVMQHEDVRKLLISTGNAFLIEHTANDRYWADGGDGKGKNMLGLILMEIREKLNNL